MPNTGLVERAHLSIQDSGGRFPSMVIPAGDMLIFSMSARLVDWLGLYLREVRSD